MQKSAIERGSQLTGLHQDGGISSTQESSGQKPASTRKAESGSDLPPILVFEGAFFAALTLILVSHYLRLFDGVDAPISAIAGFIGLIPVLKSAFKALVRRNITMDLLASIALIFSLLAGQWTSAIFISMMLSASRLFQEWSDRRARRSINSLLKLRPERVRLEKDGRLFDIPLSEVKVGDVLAVEIGKRIPVDGTVIDGEGNVDESSLTGESLPVLKGKGSPVFSSSLLISGHVHIRADKIGKDTALEKIIDLVESSQANKPKASTLGEKFGKIYLVLILLGSGLIFAFSRDLNLVLSIILVVCADDVAIAVPLAFLTAVGFAAKKGAIIKGNDYLESLRNPKIALFDKTGTLTRGVPRVEKMGLFGKSRHESVLKLAGSIAQESDHPVSKAILRFVSNHDIRIPEASNSEEVGGRGMRAVVLGKKISLGRIAFLKEDGISLPDEDRKEIERAEAEGFSISVLSVNGKPAGFFGIADEIKKSSREALRELRDLGVEKIVMITGDNEKVAKKVADEIGLDEFHANVLPEDKAAVVQKYVQAGKVTIMVGDGINDAAALSLADVGIAMGKTGYDVAIESADVILMRDDLTRIPFLIRLSRKVGQVSIQDFWIWGLTNVFGLILVFSGIIGPSGAAAYNFITDFFPLLNTLKIMRLYVHTRTH